MFDGLAAPCRAIHVRINRTGVLKSPRDYGGKDDRIFYGCCYNPAARIVLGVLISKMERPCEAIEQKRLRRNYKARRVVQACEPLSRFGRSVDERLVLLYTRKRPRRAFATDFGSSDKLFSPRPTGNQLIFIAYTCSRLWCKRVQSKHRPLFRPLERRQRVLKMNSFFHWFSRRPRPSGDFEFFPAVKRGPNVLKPFSNRTIRYLRVFRRCFIISAGV